MATEQTQTAKDFLADLARGGFAESLTPHQRRQIHIETALDGFLRDALSTGKQVVLTGNPGDGKTQHILIQQDEYPPDEYFYLLDASEYADYRSLLAEWDDNRRADVPGILAINDGPLYEMVTGHSDEYSFLSQIKIQLQNQIVYTEQDVSDAGFDDPVVLDLNNRDVLTPTIIREAIQTFAGDFALEGHDHSGQCHIQYNANKLLQPDVRDDLIDFLTELGNYERHVTIRDLINFLCYVITGGVSDCQTDFESDLKYYNLAFDGTGTVFDLARRRVDSPQLVHPFVDSRLWAEAEQEVNFSDRDDPEEVVLPLFEEKKRRFLFEDEAMDIGYESRSLYQDIEYEFINHRNGRSLEGQKERLIRMLNGYFQSNTSERARLHLWLSHRYRSKSSLALVSRTTVPKNNFDLHRPKLHPEIEDAIGYTPSHTVLEYSNGDTPIRLQIAKSLYRALSAVDADIPYTLRSRDVEQQILEFMEEIEFYEAYSEEAGTISVKDTETGRVENVEVSDTVYRR